MAQVVMVCAQMPPCQKMSGVALLEVYVRMTLYSFPYMISIDI